MFFNKKAVHKGLSLLVNKTKTIREISSYNKIKNKSPVYPHKVHHKKNEQGPDMNVRTEQRISGKLDFGILANS